MAWYSPASVETKQKGSDKGIRSRVAGRHELGAGLTGRIGSLGSVSHTGSVRSSSVLDLSESGEGEEGGRV